MPAPQAAKKPAMTFGKPEKSNPKAKIALWAFIVIAVGGIIAMVVLSPAEKHLNCSGSASLTSFGSCKEE